MSLTPIKTYLLLMIFFIMTLGASFLRLGLWNDVASYVFAFIKTMIILVSFMKWKDTFQESKYYFILGGVTLLILVIGVMDDVLFR